MQALSSPGATCACSVRRPALPGAGAHARLMPRRQQRHQHQQPRQQQRAAPLAAKGRGTTGNDVLDSVLETGQGLVESAANLVPDSVPRPVAKGGVAVAGVVVAFWLLQKLVSTVLTVALLGGAAWWYFQQAGGSSSEGSSSGGAGSGGAGQDDFDDPLAEARKIMDKYKK